MFSLRHAVPAPLQPFVAQAQGYEVPANPVGVHRGLPSRYLTLVVELAAPLRVEGLGERVVEHAVVGGLHMAPALIDASGPQEGVQYGLRPAAAAALLGLPAADLTGRAVGLPQVVGSDAGRLVDEMVEARSWAERFARLDAALLARLSRLPARETPPEVSEAWRLVFASDGQIRTARLAASVGWSRRHLTERFRLATGLTPKQASRIARFEAARRLLLDSRRPALADVAARCGYADQPHLAREWRALAGCTIGTWLREELPFLHDTSPEVGQAQRHDDFC